MFLWLQKKVYLCTRFQTTRIKIMMYNSYKYNANPTLRLAGKVAPEYGTAYIRVRTSVDLII